jgi:hypothetical protein
MSRNGPKITIHASCFGCVHVISERFQVQGDSGRDVYCSYGGEKRYVASYSDDTPEWCPLMAEALKEAGVESRDESK